VGKFPFTASGKAVAINHAEGFVKVITGKKYGEILGAHIVGPEATELIAEYGLALDAELTVDDIHATIHAHPTLSEALAEAAAAVHGEAIHIWNKDHASATYITILAERPCGRRPPVSDSATSCRISSSVMPDLLTSF
jgi:hypothetical protein